MYQNDAKNIGVPQEKVFQDLTTQISKHLAVIGEAESRLWNSTQRLLNPRPQSVPPQPAAEQAKPQTLEAQLKEIAYTLERKGANLHEIATELERGV